MSGLFLVVWDTVAEDRSPVLCTTTGGYPHITVIYTGNCTVPAELMPEGVTLMRNFFGWQISVDKAWINVFEKDGKNRYDVLLQLDGATNSRIQTARAGIARRLGVPCDDSKLHITHSIHATMKEALAAQMQVEKFLPYSTLAITGLTLD